jgi:hypothetical protein
MKISKNPMAGKETAEKAKSSIARSVENGIELNYNQGKNSKNERNRSINNLIEIASDQYLKTILDNEIILSAGKSAIELCSLDEDHLSYLIHMANKNSLPNKINILAAIKFYEVVKKDQEYYKIDIQKAARNLNTRWLNTSLDIIYNKLTEYEIEEIKNAINFIKSMRSN